jgi:hypothetical protein
VWQSKSYSADVHPIFNQAGCAGTSCHGGARPAEDLDLSTATVGYAELVNVPSLQCTSKLLVKPGDIENSYLMNKLLGTGMCFGSRMPKSFSLSPADLDIVRAWIGSGAAH